MPLLENCRLPFRNIGADERLYDDVNYYSNYVVDAEYERMEGYEDNPDYCALPEAYTDDELTALFDTPKRGCDPKTVKGMNKYSRLIAAYGISNVAVPMEHTFELASTVDRVLRISYSLRECRISERGDPGNPLPGSLISVNSDTAGRPQFFFMKGLTGTGKTFSMTQVSRLYPKVIRHVVKGYEYKQIPILTATGHVGNMKALIQSFAARIDQLLDMGSYHFEQVRNKDLGKECIIFEEWVRRYHIGLIVVDEIQYMHFGQGSNSFENFVSISEQTGCAIGMIGNLDAEKKLLSYSRITGRTIPNEIEASVKTPVARSFFEYAIENLWDYQFTDVKTELDDRIKTQLIMDSQYNISMLKNLIMMVQIDAIKQERKAEITPEFIHRTAQKHFAELQLLLMKDTPESEQKILEIFDGEKQKIADELKKEQERMRQKALEDKDGGAVLPENQGKFDTVITSLTVLNDDKYSEVQVRRAIDICMTEDPMLQYKDLKDIGKAVKRRLEGRKGDAVIKAPSDSGALEKAEEAVERVRKSA